MEYRETQCPYCKGQLQVPKHLKEFICMYCGKTVELVENVNLDRDTSNHKVKNETVRELERKLSIEWSNGGDYQEVAIKLIEEDHFNYLANCCLAFSQMINILIPHLDLMKTFKNNLYESAFRSYLEKCEPILQYFDRACLAVQSGSINDTMIDEFQCTCEKELMNRCVSYFLDRLSEYIDQSKRTKSSRSMAYDECRYILALYTVPMIEETKLEMSTEFANILITQWGERFPKHKFTKANFEEIKEGFTRKKFCFITTAVCDSLDKSDDCYELQAFRAFRDEYLLFQESGQELVQEYYRIAPVLVSKINVQCDSQRIYEDLWQNYLKGCLAYIEEKDFESCKKQYISMVNDLKTMYGGVHLFQ